MADDLDGFFDEIEEAVAEVTTETGEASATPSKQTKVQQSAQEEDSSRPSKRMRVAVASAPARPKGAVVAASAASNSNSNSAKQDLAPPPPPPPPVPSKTNHSAGRYFGPGTTVNANIHTLPPLPPGPVPPPAPAQKSNKPVVRMAAGKAWVDETLSDWPENDFRIFVGNLGQEIEDAMLLQHFQNKYSSATMAKVVRESSTQKSKGYGFVSFGQPLDCAKAIREQDQAWLGSRPIRVKRSDWQDRNKSAVQKRHRNEKKQARKRGGNRYY